LAIPLFAFFIVLTVLVLAAGLRRLMGITLSPLRTVVAALIALFSASPIITAMAGAGAGFPPGPRVTPPAAAIASAPPRPLVRRRWLLVTPGADPDSCRRVAARVHRRRP
jgi:hypothetical protein